MSAHNSRVPTYGVSVVQPSAVAAHDALETARLPCMSAFA